MSNKKQTSVKWLVWELNKLGFFPNGVPQEIYKQTQQLHKQEMIDNYKAGSDYRATTQEAEQYYKDNYECNK